MSVVEVARDPESLRRFVEEDGHRFNAAGVGRCINPDHPDSTPSMGVYPDPLGGHLHCFGCGLHLDAYQYLVDVRGLSPRMALDTLEPGREPPSARPTRPRRAPPTPVRAPEVKACASQPLPERVQAVHDARVARNTHVPAALAGRGFELANLSTLRIAQVNDDADLAITGPDGSILRIKRRFGPGQGGPRYRYLDADGTGSPAWCSPHFGTARLVLVIEGELNGMAAWLARPDLDVVGVAGVQGTLPLPALTGRDTVIYTDGDTPGEASAERWASTLAKHSCRVSMLPPWPDGDACDIAGRHGRAELRMRLT